MPKKILSPEYKRECADLMIVHGYKHKDAAAAMNASLSSIQLWVRQYPKKEQQGFTPKASTLPPEQIQIQALEKQVKQLK